MNKEFKKAITTASRNTGLSEKEVFQETIKAGLFNILFRMESVENTVFDIYKIDKSFVSFLPSLSFAKFGEIKKVYAILHNVMLESAPFDDVISEFYQINFISRKNAHGQFMTPKSIGNLLTRMLCPHKSKTDNEPENPVIAEICCGTGTIIMSHLKNEFDEYGKDSFAKHTVYLNDLDPELLRIAVYQIMFNCMKYDVRIGCLDFQCNNMITQYPPDQKYTVWGMFGKSDEAHEDTIKLRVLSNFLDTLNLDVAA